MVEIGGVITPGFFWGVGGLFLHGMGWVGCEEEQKELITSEMMLWLDWLHVFRVNKV